MKRTIPPKLQLVGSRPAALTPAALERAPELAALALLDEALLIARLALVAQHPELDDDLLREPVLATTTSLAETIVGRARDLAGVLATYRRVVDRLIQPRPRCDDDTIF